MIEKRKRWIVKLFEDGMDTREIAFRMDCKHTVINNALSQAGYEYRNRKWVKVK